MLLAAGKVHAALPENGAVSLGEGGDEAVRLRNAGGRLHFRVRRLRPAPADVLRDCPGEKGAFLGHHGDPFAQGVLVEAPRAVTSSMIPPSRST